MSLPVFQYLSSTVHLYIFPFLCFFMVGVCASFEVGIDFSR